jgi:hypothetical protein
MESDQFMKFCVKVELRFAWTQCEYKSHLRAISTPDMVMQNRPQCRPMGPLL